MNKVEISGKLHNDVKIFGEGQNKRALFVVAADDDENAEYKTFLPCIAWREVVDKIANLKKDQPIHFIAKVRRHKNKKTDAYETDIEVKEIL